MINTQYINLDMIPSGVLPVLYCSQYDIGRPLGVVVHNHSESVTLTTYTCTIEATRTDGTAITAPVTTNGNIGAFVTTATMTNKADKYPAKLVLFDSNSRRVASLAFVMCITSATMNENAEGIEEDKPLYQQYTETAQTLISAIKSDLLTETNRAKAAESTLQSNINAEATARSNAINSEASARQSADNTLQLNINAEANARATKDASLQSQINQLVAPSGAAPSEAEVRDIRNGADGRTYTTAGDAVRGQYSTLKTITDRQDRFLTAGDVLYKTLTWKVGSIRDETNEETNDSQRIRSEWISVYTKEFNLIVPNGYRAYLFEFLSNRAFNYESGWHTNTTTINLKANTAFVRIILRLSGSDRDMAASEGAGVVAFEYSIFSQIGYKLTGDEMDWHKGFVLKASGAESDSGPTTYYCTGYIRIPEYLYNAECECLSYASGDAASIAFYDENLTFISASSRADPSAYTYSVPASARYIRLSNLNGSVPIQNTYFKLRVKPIDSIGDIIKQIYGALITEDEVWR